MTTGEESPMSTSITGYYKGFSVTMTKRDPQLEFDIQIVEAEVTIDKMIARGEWKPSWSAQTNKDLVDPTWVKPKQELDEQGNCKHVNFTVKVSSGFKKPENKGKKYKLCDDCQKFSGWTQ